MLIVVESLCRTGFTALFAVEEVGAVVPYIAQLINFKYLPEFIFGNDQPAFLDGSCHDGKPHAVIVKDLLHQAVMLHLNKYSRVFREEYLDQVGMAYFVEVCLQASLRVGEAHLKHGGHHPSGGDIMTCENQPAAGEFLDR